MVVARLNHGWTTGRPWSVEGLQDGQVPEPSLKAGSVEIDVKAWALNPVDYRLAKTLPIPLIGRRLIGSDFSGVVRSVGHGITHIKVGDSVFGMLSALRGGVSAERIVVPGSCVASAPQSISLVEAASIPLAALTSLQSLRDLARITEGQKVVINGASGGVGSFGIQLARYFGAEVTAVCSKENHEWVRELGADHCLDYRDGDFLERIGMVHGIFDARGNRSKRQMAKSVEAGGWVVSTEPGAQVVLAAVCNPIRKVRQYDVVVKAKSEDLSSLAHWVDTGILKPVIERIFERHEVKDAYRHLLTRRTKGKLIVRY